MKYDNDDDDINFGFEVNTQIADKAGNSFFWL